MAILNSITIGKGRKSLGNVTLQTLGGVVVAKQKIMRNTSKSAKQQVQRQMFKKIMNILRKFAPLARAAFSRVKTSSAYARWAKAFYATAASHTMSQLASYTPYQLAAEKYAEEDDFNIVEGNKVFSTSELQTDAQDPTKKRSIFGCSSVLPGNKPINLGDAVNIEVAYCDDASGKMKFELHEVEASSAPAGNYIDGQFVIANGWWYVYLPDEWIGPDSLRYPIITVNNERIGLPFSLIAPQS